MDKPAGPTSHDVVAATRRALGLRRVGHAGTLDPPATGLLVLLAGRATRLARFIASLAKRYTGTVRFGWETASDDATGDRTVAGDLPDTPAAWDDLLRRACAALPSIASRATQVPPAVSAKKVEGRRAYRIARGGEAPVLAPAPVAIHELEAEDGWAEGVPGDLRLSVSCSAGTYVRAIARDLGREIGCPAHLASLRRTAVGEWTVEDALPFDAAYVEAAAAALRPMDEAVAHLPRVVLGADNALDFRHGRPFGSGSGVEPADTDSPYVAVYHEDALLGVGERCDGLLKVTVGLTP